MQLITPKAFNLIILTMTSASGIIVGLYGPVWMAALLFAYTIYGWVMPYYLEYVAKRIHVRADESDEGAAWTDYDFRSTRGSNQAS